MLKQEEMKMVIGGNAYESATKGGAPASSFASGTALSGALNSSNGLTISYGNNGGNYSTSYNYGAGMNGLTLLLVILQILTQMEEVLQHQHDQNHTGNHKTTI